MKKVNFRLIFLLISMSIIASFSCNTISHFDQVAYSQITSVESDVLSLMDKATEDYSEHMQEIGEVSNKIQKAYLYDKNRPKNKITEKMWDLMNDPNGNLYGGFSFRWKEEGKLGKGFISEAKIQIQKNFDKIAQLESKKIVK